MRQILFSAACAVALMPSPAHADPGPRPECRAILPERVKPGQQPLTPEDLVRLRDIGPAEPQYYFSPFFTVSPDGHSAAFQLRRANPERND